MLPVDLREYMNAFFDNLRSQRKIEHKSLVATLNSVRYRRILTTWNRYLDSITPANRSSSLSAKLLAQTVITKRNRKVLKFGKQILLTSSDDLLHQLRIEGKKLRYLLEFFSSLFAQEKIQYLIEKLKILQDNLGDFNDLFIQQEHLYKSARNIAPRNKAAKNTLLAMGILIGKLNERQNAVKKEFALLFSSYADKKVQKLFDELFSVQERHAK
jgi:CHAD domain-containing protein